MKPSDYMGGYPGGCLLPQTLTKVETVVVDGVTLTRAQVEQALKDLNTPKVIPFKCGDRVIYTPSGGGLSHFGTVITGSVQHSYLKAIGWNRADYSLTIVTDTGGGSSFRDTAAAIAGRWTLVPR